MSIDPRRQCLLCAWRENCAKKFSMETGAAHCPDFTRDRNLPEEPVESAAPPPSHKRVEDVFGNK